MKRIFAIVCVVVLGLYLSVAFAADKGYADLTVEQVMKKIDTGEKVTVVDVRTKEEYKEDGYIKGALLMPLQELDKHFRHLDKEADIIVYCRSGKRSAAASEKLVASGFKKVSNMTGGMLEWKAKGYPVAK